MAVRRAHRFATLLALAPLLGAGPVYAQRGPAPDAEAVALFDEGRRLMAESKFGQAIPKFEESVRHARTVGALLNLGRCYEEAGRIASAWATYRAAAALARELHDAREQNADGFATAVRPRVSTLTLDARALEGVTGAQVTRDGEIVGAGGYGDAAPVDAGEHVVQVTAPGKKSWSRKITVGAGSAAALRLAPLEDLPVTEAPAPAAPSPRAPTTQRTLGYVGLGVGGAGVALGAVAGLFALSKHHEATSACPSYPDHCPSDGSADGPNSASRTWATVSTIGFLAGGAAAAVGIALLATSPREAPATGVRVVPIVTARGAGLGAVAAW